MSLHQLIAPGARLAAKIPPPEVPARRVRRVILAEVQSGAIGRVE